MKRGRKLVDTLVEIYLIDVRHGGSSPPTSTKLDLLNGGVYSPPHWSDT